LICKKCGEEMRMTEKDTASGRDIREYECAHCGHSDWEVCGPALWQLLSDDRKAYEASQLQANLSNPQPPAAQPHEAVANAQSSFIQGVIARIFKRK
jgi:hypothetical protein